MTDRVEALRALLRMVEAGEWDHSPNGVARAVFPYKSASIDDMGLTAVEAFNGSLDNAMDLHDAVLPGWGWRFDDKYGDGMPPEFEKKFAWVSNPNNWRSGQTAQVREGNEARAWLCAIVKALIQSALISEAEQTGGDA